MRQTSRFAGRRSALNRTSPEGIDASQLLADDELVELAHVERRILLTSDSGIMRMKRITSGEVPSLYVPRNISVARQVEHVLQHFGLKRLAPRCMKCGGALTWIPKASVRGEAPPRTYCWLDDFYRCLRCGQLFWQGTHWNKISKQLDDLTPGA